jgi:hypothetical protein
VSKFLATAGIERRAVGEGDAGADLEDVLRGVGIDRPALGDPRLDLERLGILVGELVGDLVENAAVGIETARGWIEIRVGLLLQVDQRSALGDRWLRGGATGNERNGSQRRKRAGE